MTNGYPEGRIYSRLKILKQFIKSKIALFLMETILFIFGKLKYLESLVTWHGRSEMRT
jgi:hypothetical protein